jgi:hypothetical protein
MCPVLKIHFLLPISSRIFSFPLVVSSIVQKTHKFTQNCNPSSTSFHFFFVGLAYYQGKTDIVFRFIIEYGSLRAFGS